MENKNNDNKFYSGKNNNDRKPDGFKKHPFAFILFLFLIISFAFMLFNPFSKTKEQIAYSDFISLVKSKNVISADIKNATNIDFVLSDGNRGTTRIPYHDANLLKYLEESKVNLRGSEADVNFFILILQSLPWLIFMAYMIFIWKQMKGSNSQLMGVGKSKAKRFLDEDNKTTFKDVAGQKEAKYELEEVVEFLKNPKRFANIGARLPKGVLLVGPPGTGKTLLARAVAGEAKVNFLHTSGSDFVEMFVGMGAARVRDLFSEARKHAPSIVFIDELDAVGRSRGAGLGGGHDEREQTLNQMLVEMDGFENETGIIVIAATNRPDVLDPALLRAGRFDREVTVSLPDIKEREDILAIHSKKVKLEDDVNLEVISRATPGSSGADLANLVNEAALFAARDERVKVNMLDFEKARDKILFGVEKKSMVMSEEDTLATAYHEAGHALLHYYVKSTDPLHKVTVIPRGRALGLTMSLPVKDAYSMNYEQLIARIKITMGGYIAEELIYGQTTTGTSQDIKQATSIARKMVTEWGMSPLGFCSFEASNEPIFLGREISHSKSYSDQTALAIDKEVSKILDKALNDCRELLTKNKADLDKLAHALVEKETMDDAQIRELLGFEEAKVSTKFIN